MIKIVMLLAALGFCACSGAAAVQTNSEKTVVKKTFKKKSFKKKAALKKVLLVQPSDAKPMTNDDLQALAQELAQRYGLAPQWAGQQLALARLQPRITELMQLPPPDQKKNWGLYRSRFVNEQRIAAGLAFWRAHQAAFARAQQVYGVPPSIILGILGVETVYGRHTGSFRVLDALATLTLNYPERHPRREARMQYFRGELGQFLWLCQAQRWDCASIQGSYAGAMGMPQFMPTSWRQDAVDFDGDGVIDLWTSPADVIGSVANYFVRHGWTPQMAQLAAAPATSDKTASKATGKTVVLENGDAPPTLYPIDERFAVITQYNRSDYYAATVLDLAAAIDAQLPKELLPAGKQDGNAGSTSTSTELESGSGSGSGSLKAAPSAAQETRHE